MFDSIQSPASLKRPLPQEHLLQSKRRKLLPTPDHSHSEPETFWDRLSQVVLSRRALKEFDRRIQARRGEPEITVAHVPDLPRGRQRTLLKRFARQGGPSLTHLRGFACRSITMSTSSSQSRKRSALSARSQPTRTSKTSPYSGQYEAGLNDAHIYIEGHDYGEDEAPEPNNLSTIQQRLMLERASLSPSRFTAKDFQNFKRSCAQSRSETRVVQQVMHEIGGKGDHFKTEADVEFNNIEPFNKGLAAAKPDSYDGALTSSIHKVVRDDLDPWITPSTNSTNPIAPNFFLEAKSFKGTPVVAMKQACHNGAIGARAMHRLQNYGADEPVYDGNAYSFSSTYQDGLLKLYSTHPVAPAAEGEPAGYHMTQIDSYAMTGNIRYCREGMRAYRNARDMAKEVRENHIRKANEVAETLAAQTHTDEQPRQPDCHTSSFTAPEADLDTSEDELALSPAPSKRSRHER